jgi:transposase
MTHHLTDRITEQKSQLQFSDELKEEAAYRVLILREPIQEVIEQLGIPNVYIVNNWINLYKKRIEAGLVSLPPMTEKENQDLQALQQRTKQLEKALKDANLMILALNTMIDVAEEELKIPVRKKRGTKQ